MRWPRQIQAVLDAAFDIDTFTALLRHEIAALRAHGLDVSETQWVAMRRVEHTFS